MCTLGDGYCFTWCNYSIVVVAVVAVVAVVVDAAVRFDDSGSASLSIVVYFTVRSSREFFNDQIVVVFVVRH